MNLPKVSLIIVNYNGFRITKRCVESIFQTTGGGKMETIIVDNNSTDGSAIKLRETFGRKSNLQIIPRKSNDFLAAAYNEGFRHCHGEIVIFMNNDLTFTSGWLREIINSFSEKKVGIVGATILSAREKNKIDNRGGRLNFLGYGMSIIDEKNPFYIPGMLLAIRRSVFMRVGKFDESYGANYEDVDLAWRVRFLGYKVLVAKRAVVYHLNSWTVNKYLKKPVSSYLCRKNRLATILKNGGKIYLFLALPLYFLLQLVIFLKEFFVDRNVALAFTTPRAIYWNFANLKLILIKRERAQKLKQR